MTRGLFGEAAGGTGTGVWRIGTSGWSYPPASGRGSWTGVFYPLARTDELKFYSRYFNTVEVNSTFYRPCSPRTAVSWVQRTPDHFEFTVKLWQQFTHKKELWTAAEIGQFREGIAPLAEAGKLGCLLFQFPASFRATPANLHRVQRLAEEFHDFPRAIELRHQSWNDAAPVIRDTGSVPAFIDEPKFRDSIRQELGASGGLLYLRFHGRNGEAWWKPEHRNDRYDYLYSSEEINPYVVRLKEVVAEAAIEKAYIFFNNHPNAKAIANAVMMRAALDLPLDADLPQRLLEAYPGLK